MAKRKKGKRRAGNLTESDKLAVKMDSLLKRGGLPDKYKEVLTSMKISYLRHHSLTPQQMRYAASIMGEMNKLKTKNRKKAGYVYLVRAGGAVKIGKSRSPKERVKGLQTGNHDKVILCATFECETSAKATIFERRLHKRFKASRLRGEWFDRAITNNVLCEAYDGGKWVTTNQQGE